MIAKNFFPETRFIEYICPLYIIAIYLSHIYLSDKIYPEPDQFISYITFFQLYFAHTGIYVWIL